VPSVELLIFVSDSDDGSEQMVGTTVSEPRLGALQSQHLRGCGK
jgi:hypothetical protein